MEKWAGCWSPCEQAQAGFPARDAKDAIIARRGRQAATSPRSPPPAGSWPWSITGCATARSAVCPNQPGPRERARPGRTRGRRCVCPPPPRGADAHLMGPPGPRPPTRNCPMPLPAPPGPRRRDDCSQRHCRHKTHPNPGQPEPHGHAPAPPAAFPGRPDHRLAATRVKDALRAPATPARPLDPGRPLTRTGSHQGEGRTSEAAIPRPKETTGPRNPRSFPRLTRPASSG